MSSLASRSRRFAQLDFRWHHLSFSRVCNGSTCPRRQWLSTTATLPNASIVPLRKKLKDEAKEKKRQPVQCDDSHSVTSKLRQWELTVGIEIHAELNTAVKLFSEAPTSSEGVAPNSNVALFDLAYPGSQPVFQKATLLPALRAALALNCEVMQRSAFDRKHYFYQDQPAGYQITQYYEPFARDGYIILYDYDGIAPEDGDSIKIGIKQIQMEQDTAKTIQNPPSEHLLDFNRVSHPLIEIITLPQLHYPSTAAALVRKIQSILKAVNACTIGMELGGLRADVNVSVRRREPDGEYTGSSYHGVTGLGQRTEIKNLSSFKAVEDAIVAERDRQIRLLEAGGTVESETRGWTVGSSETRKLRSKEGEIDYRYIPDPDIPPVIIGSILVDYLRESMPMLPDQLLELLTEGDKHGLTMKDAKTLLSFDDGDRLEYYFDVLERVQQIRTGNKPSALGRTVANWVLHELGALLSKSDLPWERCLVTSDKLADIIALVQQSKITNASAKRLLGLLFAGDERDVNMIIIEEGMLVKRLDESAYATAAQKLLAANPDVVKAIKHSKQNGKIMWLVGQMMKEMSKEHGSGSVKPDSAKTAVLKELDLPL